MSLKNIPWMNILKFLAVVIAALGLFWWLTVVPRQQTANLTSYEWQVRSACHAQANQLVQEQFENLSEEQRAEVNDVALYEVQYTLCRRANGVSD